MAVRNDDSRVVLFACDSQQSVLAARSAEAHDATAYSPYGQRHARSHVAQPGFNGELPEPATGLYLLGNGYRAYNPVLMRFHQPDSWSPFGAGGFNPYVYCLGDPINFRDPTGHMAWLGGVGLEALMLLASPGSRADTSTQGESGGGSSLWMWLSIGLGVASMVGVGGMLAAGRRRRSASPQTHPLDLSSSAPQTHPLDLSVPAPQTQPMDLSLPKGGDPLSRLASLARAPRQPFPEPTLSPPYPGRRGDGEWMKAVIDNLDSATLSRYAREGPNRPNVLRKMKEHLPTSSPQARARTRFDEFKMKDLRTLQRSQPGSELYEFLERMVSTVRGNR
ncbi:RHS repeat-associated core domain-containing protein [Pseudomonas japonica]|nr:RHS repeat-associated core domain-containing protein [Pseudomonas japonica]